MLARVNQPLETSSQLDANLAKQFAWLLRPDLRESYQTKDNPAFGDWWLIKGRQEYPAWAQATPAQELQPLFESAGKATVAGVPVEVPKVVQLLARFRGDAVRDCTFNGKLDNEKFFAWALVVGLADHQLAAHIPRPVLAMLDQPVPALNGADQEATPQTAPAATLLMYLLWRLMDEPTQQARNIFTPEGRKAYLAWFFGVVEQLHIAPLVAGRWKSWVKSQPGYKDEQLAWASAAPALPTPSRTPKADKPFGVNLYGFAYGELGIGEDLRMAVACCEAANIPYHVVNVDAGNIRQADNLLKGKTHDLHSKELPPYRNNIFCLPAFDTASRVFMQKGASAFEGYHNIGWWPWELSVFPKAWQPHAFKLVDEVWASSTFLEDMYKRSTDKPVHLVPLAVSVDRIKRHPRKYYGLPDKKYLFLYVFDFNSSVARKNPMAAVNAFKQAFPQTDTTVGLVLKTMNTNPDHPEWQAFLKECKADKRILILTETMDRPDVLGLIDCCDAYVSLHRAEGFGRTIAEAIKLGKKVIATNYSGNVDFIRGNASPVNYVLLKINSNEYESVDEKDDIYWADAYVDEASIIMKNMKINKNFEKTNVDDIFSVSKTCAALINYLHFF
ncbi:glycosyltransferase [Limnohabitans sp.]|uniref:glycosyltransferase n=1 Tax=Limnohabitans sp. TaxID=1907725 RepID=UPI0038BC73D1